MSTEKPLVDIIIVNWNSGSLLRDCIISINNFASLNVASVIIIDNASVDNSLNRIGFEGLTVNIIRNDSNLGFAAACNQGAAEASSDYLLFLNPDTRLFKDSLAIPLAFLHKEENADIGICGVQLVDESYQIVHSCSRFPTVWMFLAQALALNRLPWFKSWNSRMTEWDHSSNHEVDQVIGAYFFVRHSLFNQLAGFDERFFVYFEEVDFSFRAKLAGWQSMYLADTQVFHVGGGTTSQVKAHRLFYSLRSRLLYGFKHFSNQNAVLLLIITVVLEPVSRIAFSIVRGSFSDVRDTFNAYRMLFNWSLFKNS